MAFHHSNPSCNCCSIHFESKAKQAAHFSYEHFEWLCWVCDDCSIKFATQCDLDSHVVTAHATEVLQRSQHIKQAEDSINAAALAAKGAALGKRKRKASVAQLPTPDTSPQSNSSSCTPPIPKKQKTTIQLETTLTYSSSLRQENLTREQDTLRREVQGNVIAIALDPPSQSLPQALVDLGYLPHHFDPRTKWATTRGDYRDIPCDLPDCYIFRADPRLIAYGNLFRLAQWYSNTQIAEKANEGRPDKIFKNTQAVSSRVKTAVRAMGPLWPMGEQGLWQFLEDEKIKHGVARAGKKPKRKDEVLLSAGPIPDFEFD